MSALLHDLRYAVRTLSRAPGFTAVAIMTLSLGIGANTAIFSLVNATLLRDLPYPSAGSIVRVYQTHSEGRSTASPSDFVDWRAESKAFTAMAAFHRNSYTLTESGEPQQIRAAQVTGDFFGVLAVPLALGRAIGASDAEMGAEPTVVLGNEVWRTQFGADPRVIGTRVQLDGSAYTVIGVAAPGFEYPRGAAIWTPRRFSADDLATQRGAHYLDVVARLAPEMTVERASTEIAGIAERLAAEYPTTNRETSGTVIPLRESLVGDVRAALYVLLGAVALVLLIACANVANLLVARALSRRRDLALRQAVGASRGRLTRMVLAESLVLAVAGGSIGVLLAAWGTPLLAQLRPDDPFLQAASIDMRVLLVTMAVSLFTGLLFGIFPALRLVPPHGLSQQLVGGGRGSSVTAEAHRARRVLAISEMMLAFVLLVGAGLLMRSFVALQRTDLGFATDSRLSFTVATPDARYDTPERVESFYTQVIERMRAIPGVEQLGATQALPLSGNSFGITAHSIDGRELPEEEKDRLATQIRIVRPDFFSAMSIPVVRGRAIEDTDRMGAPGAIVLSESAAELMFPGIEALGHEAVIGTSFGLGRGRAGGTVVGVVRDTRDFGADDAQRPMLYLSHAQYPVSTLQFVVQANRAPETLTGPLREAVATVDPQIPVFGVETMESRFSESIAQPRFLMTLLALFAFTAIVLASIGLYGVISYGVSERTREIGIRMALGARQSDVLGMIMRRGWGLGVWGIALGLVAAFAGARMLSAQLYGVQPIDPLTLAAAVLILMPVALLASWIPARRAARVDPAITLRME